MNYIDKLFKQYPFIYCIGGEYYAFGTITCAKCGTSSVLLEKRYRAYEESINQDMENKEAWTIFHALMAEAQRVKIIKGECIKPQEEILKFNFNEEQMEELKSQMKRYTKYISDHQLAEKLRGII